MSTAAIVVIDPDWEEIEKVRSAVTDFLGDEVGNDVVDALTMVASELTENALKYGNFAGDAKVAVEIKRRPNSITVEVRNPVDQDSDDNLTRLDVMVQWIRGHQDPFEAYLQRMEEVSRQSLESQESGLGLVRIAYEGKSILDFYVDEHNTLAVSAVHLL